MKKTGYIPPITMDLLSLFHDINGTSLVVNLEDGIVGQEQEKKNSIPGMILWDDHKYFAPSHSACCGETTIVPRIRFSLTLNGEDEEYDDDSESHHAYLYFRDYMSCSVYLRYFQQHVYLPLMDQVTDIYGHQLWDYSSSGSFTFLYDNYGKKFKAAGAAIGWNAWVADTVMSGNGFTDMQAKIMAKLRTPSSLAGNYIAFKNGLSNGGIVEHEHYKNVAPGQEFYLLPLKLRQLLAKAMDNDDQWTFSMALSLLYKSASEPVFKQAPTSEYIDKPLQFVDPGSQIAKLGSWKPAGTIVIPADYAANIPTCVVNVHFEHDPDNCTFCSQTGYVLDEAQVHQKLLQVAI